MKNPKRYPKKNISNEVKRSFNPLKSENRWGMYYHNEVIKLLKPFKVSAKPAIALVLMRKLLLMV